MTRSVLCAAVVGLALATGCTPAKGRVKGRVTCEGKPFPSASITFSPIPKADDDKNPGRAAGGGTDSNGSYVLMTSETDNGIVVGRHRVSIVVEYPERPYPCKGFGEIILEVKPGDNEINIELSDYSTTNKK